MAQTIQAKILGAEGNWKALKKWRDKHLAHLDLAAALGQRLTPLQPVTATVIEQALQSMRDILNTIEKEYFDSEVLCDVAHPNDADSLVAVLRLGLKFDADRERRLHAGQEQPGDWDIP